MDLPVLRNVQLVQRHNSCMARNVQYLSYYSSHNMCLITGIEGAKDQNTAATIAVQEPIPVPYMQSKRAKTLQQMLAGAT